MLGKQLHIYNYVCKMNINKCMEHYAVVDLASHSFSENSKKQVLHKVSYNLQTPSEWR
jgi:hypothetical protein